VAIGGGAMPPGLPLTSTDPRGAVTRYAYFANGDLAKLTEPSGLVTSYTYDALGRKLTETQISDTYPAGLTTSYTYDTQSRPVSTVEPATSDAVSGVAHQRETTQAYDVDGNVNRTDVSDLLGADTTRTTTYEYDEHNRVSHTVDAEGGETTYSYDEFGNCTSTVDANGNRYEYAYTARNALAEVRLRHWTGDPAGAGDPGPGDYLVLNSYGYDYAGRLVRHTDAMGHRVEYAYYGDGLLSTATLKGMHNPDGSTRDYVVEADSYDGAGNLLQQVTGNGTMTTRYTVNKTGQVDSVTDDPTGLHLRPGRQRHRGGHLRRRVQRTVGRRGQHRDRQLRLRPGRQRDPGDGDRRQHQPGHHLQVRPAGPAGVRRRPARQRLGCQPGRVHHHVPQ
jgi:YD repeat-containing protein